MTYARGHRGRGRVVHIVDDRVPVGRFSRTRYVCGNGSNIAGHYDDLPIGERCVRCFRLTVESVYFLRRADGAIKIGYSRAPEDRARALDASLLASHPAPQSVEAFLHAVFADDRLDGEWFRPTPALLALIVRLDRQDAA